MKTRDFEELVRRGARKRRGDDEWQLAMPLTLLASRRAPRRVIFTTKTHGLVGRHVTELAGASTTCMWRYGITSSTEWSHLRVERERGAAVVGFLGDLDPLDLAASASLVAGAPVHEMNVVHLGVDDAWVRLCQMYLLPKWRTLPTIAMSRFEVAAYHALRELPGAIASSVGPECRALLDAGQKLEMEGASNPAFYREGFAEALMRALRRRVARLGE